MIRNKRKSERFLPQDNQCIFKIAGGNSEGILLNKSEEGIRVGSLNLLILFADQQVVIEMENEVLVGRCRSVLREESGTFQVGILREPENFEDDSDSILINSFVKLGEQKLVCVPKSIEGQMIQVSLLNDEEVEVHMNQVMQMTREERLDELCDEDYLQAAIRTYELESQGNSFAERSLVLLHEFGPANTPYQHSNE